MKSRVLTSVLNGIFAVGMSTVNATSRFGTYEPDEDVELAKWAEQRSDREVN